MSRTARRVRSPVVLHADDDLLVVDKPPGMLVGTGNSSMPGAADLLRGRDPIPGSEPILVVHRIDPDASGAVAYARDADVRRALVAQFAESSAQLTLQALVRGYVEGDGQVELAVYFDKRRNLLRASTRRGTAVRTNYRVLERVAGNTWLECRVQAAHPDLVRVHLAAIDHPLAIDPVYGDAAPLMLSNFKTGYRPSKRHDERPLIERLTLHVAAIELDHPRSGRRQRFEAPLPKDLRATVRQLGLLR